MKGDDVGPAGSPTVPVDRGPGSLWETNEIEYRGQEGHHDILGLGAQPTDRREKKTHIRLSSDGPSPPRETPLHSVADLGRETYLPKDGEQQGSRHIARGRRHSCQRGQGTQ